MPSTDHDTDKVLISLLIERLGARPADSFEQNALAHLEFALEHLNDRDAAKAA